MSSSSTWITNWNEDPKPYIWHKTADEILDSLASWRLTGRGYEFCNCQPGCTCNFSGFPTSPDGSCKAAVANQVVEGRARDRVQLVVLAYRARLVET